MMKLDKKNIVLIAGLAGLLLLMMLLLSFCGTGGEEPVPSAPVETTSQPTEQTAAPTTQATEEPTEPTTEPTEATTAPTTGGSSTPGGTGGFNGGDVGDTEEDTPVTQPTQPTEPPVVIDAPGTAKNPYVEIFDENLGACQTVKIPLGQTISYNLYGVGEAVLTVESADAYVVYQGVTYEPKDGKISLPMAATSADAPVPVQIGTRAAAETVYTLNFSWPKGDRRNPYKVSLPKDPSQVTTESVPAGGSLYYDVYDVSGSTLTVEGNDVYVVYNGTTYSPENGVVTVPIAEGESGKAASLQIGNKGAEPKAYTLTFTFPEGHSRNPYQAAVPKVPGKLVTAQIPEDTTVYYEITGAAGTVMSIADADMAIVYGGKTYTAVDGVVTVPIAASEEDAPAKLQIINRGSKAKAYSLNFAWPLGHEYNPYTKTLEQIPATVPTAEIPAGNTVYYCFNS